MTMAEDRPKHMLLLPDPKRVETLGIPVMPFRIRAEAMDDVKDEEGQMRLDVLVDEWAKVLADDRELRALEGPALALWCNVIATQRGQEGDADGAEHYCRLGLQFAPTNLTLQAKLGLALMQQGNLAQALVQFKHVMDDPRVGFGPTLWLAAGRTAMQLGLHAEAVRILEEVAAYVPNDEGFWDLLGHARAEAGLKPHKPPKVRPAAPPAAAAPQWESVDEWTKVDGDDEWKRAD